MQQPDAGGGLAVERSGAVDLERGAGAKTWSFGVAPARSARVTLEPREVLLRQVDAAAAQVLADVADEVGELERLSERAGWG